MRPRERAYARGPLAEQLARADAEAIEALPGLIVHGVLVGGHADGLAFDVVDLASVPGLAAYERTEERASLAQLYPGRFRVSTRAAGHRVNLVREVWRLRT